MTYPQGPEIRMWTFLGGILLGLTQSSINYESYAHGTMRTHWIFIEFWRRIRAVFIFLSPLS